MKCQYRFTSPPKALQRARLDNLALVPGNLLPLKKEYQAIANTLPQGSVLVVLPAPVSKENRIAHKVAQLLSHAGHQVTVLPTSRFAGSS